MKVFRGLKVARFGFTDIIDAARAGEEVVIVEVGHNRKEESGYKLVKLTDQELKAVLAADPASNIPKPGIPLPQVKLT